MPSGSPHYGREEEHSEKRIALTDLSHGAEFLSKYEQMYQSSKADSEVPLSGTKERQCNLLLLRYFSAHAGHVEIAA